MAFVRSPLKYQPKVRLSQLDATPEAGDPNGLSAVAKSEEISKILQMRDEEENDFLLFLKDQYKSLDVDGKVTFDAFHEWKAQMGCFFTYDEVKDMFNIVNNGIESETMSLEQFVAVNKIIDEQ